MSNNESWTDRLNSYAQEKKWPISWDPAVGIGEHPHTHLWIVKCTVKGVPYKGQPKPSKQKAKDSASEVAWRALAIQDDG